MIAIVTGTGFKRDNVAALIFLRCQVVWGMPPRAPEVTNGSMPTYSDPARMAAAMISAAISFWGAPTRAVARPACMPASLATAAFSI